MNLSILEVNPDVLENDPSTRESLQEFIEEFTSIYDECYSVFPHDNWNNVLVLSDIDILPEEATVLVYAAKQAVDLVEANGSVFGTYEIDEEDRFILSASYGYQEDVQFVPNSLLTNKVSDLLGVSEVHLYPAFGSGLAYFDI